MPPPSPLRLAILEADTPVPGACKTYTNYTGVFTHLLSTTTDLSSSDIIISGHHIVDDEVARTPYPRLEDVDAVLISGSKHNAHDDDGWILELVEFTRRCLDSKGKVKVVGVCFGHQIVARALGLKTGPNEAGWEVSVTEIGLTEMGKKVFAGMDTLKIHQMHRDIVFDIPSRSAGQQTEHSLPGGVEVLASNGICHNQGMYVPGKLMTVQGHPEFNEAIIDEILALRHDSGAFNDDLYESGMKRAGEKHDGIAIATAFLSFCREG